MDIRTDELESCPSEIVEDVIGQILQSYRKGNHVFVVERTLVDYLVANYDLGRQNKATLLKLKMEYAQTGRLYTKSPFYLNIVGDDVVATSTPYGAKIGLRKLASTRILERPVFVLESIGTDQAIYDVIFKILSRWERLPALRYQCMHGGGDGISTCIEHQVRDRLIVCSVVDSDQKYPGGAGGGKLRRIKRVTDQYAWPLICANMLPCHEIENILSPNAYKKMGIQPPHTIDMLCNIYAKETVNSCRYEDRYHLYVDIKNGHKITEFVSMIDDGKRWIKEKLAFAGVDADSVSVSGLHSLSEEFKNEKEFIAAIDSCVRDSEWRSHFEGTFMSLIWRMIGGPELRS